MADCPAAKKNEAPKSKLEEVCDGTDSRFHEGGNSSSQGDWNGNPGDDESDV